MAAYPSASESVTADIPIDPALIEQQVSINPSPTKVTGSKRKSRGSGGVTSTGNANAAGPSRVTRRSAAASSSATTTGSHGVSGHNNVPVGLSEPARGEEENLNAYRGTATNKRARRSSPTKRSAALATANRFYPPDENGIPHQSTSVSANANSINDAELRYDASIDGFDTDSALAGIEELAAAAIAANDKSANAAYNHASQPYHYASTYPYPYPYPYPYTYPVGLTPFRYPCLTPDEPPPPPGDPKDPKFRPFDPDASLGPTSGTNGNQSATTEPLTVTEADSVPNTTQSTAVPINGANVIHVQGDVQAGRILSQGDNGTDPGTLDSAQPVPTLAAAQPSV
ncbi:hypothetical protein IAU59_000712 [Kwoniella sp. CBS 9459]